VHIHGVHDEPESIVLPGRSMQALKEDEPFKTALRMLLAPHFILYLGYSFPEADDYLRSEIEWIRDNLTDTQPGRVRDLADRLSEGIRLAEFSVNQVLV
jgi:hypothetical protein